MGNVTLPTPVALAGGAFCILGGYLLGVVAGPGTPSRTAAVVDSYDPTNGRLCLTGDTLTDQEGVGEGGRLCGTWRRSEGAARLPEPGDDFRFVSVEVSRPPVDEGGDEEEDAQDGSATRTVIYGDVVP